MPTSYRTFPLRWSRRPIAVLYWSRPQLSPATGLRPVWFPVPPHPHGEITSSAPVIGFIAENEPGTGRTDSTGRSCAEAAGRNHDMTGSTPAIIIMIVVVMITLAAWIILVFYADAHPEWRRRAASGHGHGQADGSPGRPTPGRESPGRAARETEASAAAGPGPGASAAPATGNYAGRASAD
jgi:hypothetical protein